MDAVQQEDPVNILLVDDRPENLLAVEAALCEPNYHLFKAPSGQAALALLKKHEFAVILLDVQMPVMDGYETARRIRSEECNQTTPILFVTAISREETFIHKGYEVGAVDYLFKPLDTDVLKSKVAIFVELYLKRKQIELQSEQIRAGELRERDALLENSLDAVVGINEKGEITYWNRQAETTFGWNKVEALGRKMAEMIIPPDQREAHYRGMSHFMKTGVGPILNQRLEVAALRRDGNTFTVELTISAVRTQDVHSFYAFLRDITDRKRAEEELRNSRDQLKIIFEGVADGILVQNRAFKCVYANDTGAKLCGFASAEAFCNADIQELLTKFELRDEEGNPFPLDRLPARLALSGVTTPPDTILRVRNLATEAETWSIVSARPIFNKEGIAYLAVSIFRDITARRVNLEKQKFLAKATQVLSSSLDYNETLQSLARIAVSELSNWCAIDLLEKSGPKSVAVAHPDPRMLKLAEELRVKYPPDWDAPSGSPKVLRTGESELYPNLPDSLLVAAAKDDDHLRIIRGLGMVSAMVVPIQARSKVLGALTLISTNPGRHYNQDDLEFAQELGRRAGVAVDNARLYQDAQEAIAARDEFLSIASHELRTPLTSLKLQAQMQHRKYERDDPTFLERTSIGKFIDITTKQVDRLSKLVDDMLDISRIAHRKLAIDFEEVNLGHLVRDVLDHFEDQVKLAGCQIQFTVKGEVIGRWDPFRMEQVVTNLLTNAIKYSPGKPIDVSVSSNESVAILKMRDRGIGIAKENLERIFSRFERAIPASEVSGFGLGLYISRQIVEAHHGRISVESELGFGSTFTVELPI